MKCASACWFIRLFEYLENNPVNGFLAAGISQSIDAGHPIVGLNVVNSDNDEDTDEDEDTDDENPGEDQETDEDDETQ